MNLPDTYTEINETGCCAVPNIADWDNKKVKFTDKYFIRQYTNSFLYMPLNMASVMKSLNNRATIRHAMPSAEQVMILSRDISPWKAEQLFAVINPIDGADNVTLNGTFLTKVFEGPYKNAKQWYSTMQQMATDRGNSVENTYFFYTTCPKCAKHYGKNYTIGLAKITN